MKNDYNQKKRITIILLAVVAVCLAGGLFWYMGTLGSTQPPVALAENQTETEPTVTIPESQPDRTSKPETVSEPETATEPETSSEPETTGEPETAARQEKESSRAAGTVTGAVRGKPSADKPKSPVEAKPPAELPADAQENTAPVENPDAGGQCQPEHTPQMESDQPRAGEKKDGKIYAPGFGWVEDKGGGSEVYEAPNAGTGKPIGEM